jgi:hypothetical protein
MVICSQQVYESYHKPLSTSPWHFPGPYCNGDQKPSHGLATSCCSDNWWAPSARSPHPVSDNTNPNTLYQSPRQNASEKSVCIYKHTMVADDNPNTLNQSPRQNASEKSVCIYKHTMIADDNPNTLYQSQRQNASEKRLCIYKHIMVADDKLTAICWMDLLRHNPVNSLQICLSQFCQNINSH